MWGEQEYLTLPPEIWDLTLDPVLLMVFQSIAVAVHVVYMSLGVGVFWC